MTAEPVGSMQLRVPADVRFFRPVRLAVGGLATLAGFDVEAIDDIRIGTDELCGALFEAGDGSDLVIEVLVDVGRSLRVVGTSAAGSDGFDADHFAFARQILSVVADDFGVGSDGGVVRCWLVRHVVDEPAETDAHAP